MEDLAAFTALNHLGSFGKNFVKFKKNKNVIYRLWVGPYGENCDRGLTVGLGQHFQDLDHSFSPYGPPMVPLTGTLDELEAGPELVVLTSTGELMGLTTCRDPV